MSRNRITATVSKLFLTEKQGLGLFLAKGKKLTVTQTEMSNISINKLYLSFIITVSSKIIIYLGSFNEFAGGNDIAKVIELVLKTGYIKEDSSYWPYTGSHFNKIIRKEVGKGGI